MPEAAEFVEPGDAEDEAAGCVRAGRAGRWQRDPVLQHRGGKRDENTHMGMCRFIAMVC